MKPFNSQFRSLKKFDLTTKTLVGISVIIVLSGIHFFQRYSWLELTQQTLRSEDLLIMFLGYGIFMILTPIIFLLHYRFQLNPDKLLKSLSIHLLLAVLISLIHNLLFSTVYYFSNEAWQGYAFSLLYKDVLLNYFNTGLIFYGIAITFSEAYNRLQKTQSIVSSQDTIAIKDQGKTHLFKIEEIQYFLSADNYVKVCAAEKRVLTRESMANLESKLDPTCFLRIHRSALINKAYISEITRTPTGEINLVMQDRTILPMSRRRKEVKALLASNYLN